MYIYKNFSHKNFYRENSLKKHRNLYFLFDKQKAFCIVPSMKYLKSIIYGIFCTCLITSVFSVSKATFDDEIKNMGIDTNALSDAKGVSRYDITRLLNASECKDCIHPPQDMIGRYT